MQKSIITDYFKAAQQSDIEFFRNLSSQNGDDIAWLSKSYPKSGDTACHYAARFGHLELLAFLIDCGADVEVSNFDGKHLLHESAQYGQTPLMLACTKPDLDIICELTQHGAGLKLVNKDGWTPFHIACREGHLEIVQYLLQLDNALWDTATLHGCYDVVEYLLKHCRFDVNVKDSCGSTPVMDALRSGHVKADVLIEDNFGYHCLHQSAQTGCLDSVQYLVEECHVDVNSLSSLGFSALAVAAK
ncbi:hypothetical protein KUTeg_021386, partial [Tegillarca granosa]